MLCHITCMSDLFRFPAAARDDDAVSAWFAATENPLRALAKNWFDKMRACGPDVREILHDGHPTACAEDAAFAYVDAFSTHLNVGFYQGAALPDAAGILEGAGKRMRHVKVGPGRSVNDEALQALIHVAHADMIDRLQNEKSGSSNL